MAYRTLHRKEQWGKTWLEGVNRRPELGESTIRAGPDGTLRPLGESRRQREARAEEETDPLPGAKTAEGLTQKYSDQNTGSTDGGPHALVEGEVPNSHRLERQTRQKHVRDRVVVPQKYVKDTGIQRKAAGRQNKE